MERMRAGRKRAAGGYSSTRKRRFSVTRDRRLGWANLSRAVVQPTDWCAGRRGDDDDDAPRRRRGLPVMPRSQVPVLENGVDQICGPSRSLRDYRGGTPRFEFNAQPSPNDLGGYVSALCFLRGALEAMAQEVALLRKRDEVHQRTMNQYREQIRSAAAMQRDLLPITLPEVAGLEVHTLFRPAEALSGDLYDVFRINEAHVGFSVADATGHGLSGGVLSTFASRSLRGACGWDGSLRSLRPDDVLAQANRDLLAAGFNDCPFVTALYAVYHEPTRTLTWARGGAPYPILVRPRETPRQIVSQGPLVGALDEPNFEVMTLTLEPGDAIVFHTDGLETLVSDPATRRACCDLSHTEWFQRLGEERIERQLGKLEARLATIDETDWRVDDVTVVALQMS